MTVGDYIAYFVLWPLLVLIVFGIWWIHRPAQMTPLEQLKAKQKAEYKERKRRI